VQVVAEPHAVEVAAPGEVEPPMAMPPPGCASTAGSDARRRRSFMAVRVCVFRVCVSARRRSEAREAGWRCAARRSPAGAACVCARAGQGGQRAARGGTQGCSLRVTRQHVRPIPAAGGERSCSAERARAARAQRPAPGCHRKVLPQRRAPCRRRALERRGRGAATHARRSVGVARRASTRRWLTRGAPARARASGTRRQQRLAPGCTAAAGRRRWDEC
jgi:hypothetical protein